MPLFKITEKRRIKKQKEDDSGITEMKVAMGLDEESGSDESESEDEGSGSGSEDGSESAVDDDEDETDGGEDEDEDAQDSADESEDIAQSPSKGKRDLTDDLDPADDNSEEEEGDDRDSDEESLDDDIPMSVPEALEDPIYPIQPPLSTCLLCPGKILKTPESITIHLKSAVHVRSSKRFAAKVKDIESDGVDLEDVDPREVVRLCLRDVKGVKRGEAPISAVEEDKDTAKSTDAVPSKRRRGKSQREEEKLAKRRKEWEEKGREGEFVGMNRKERRRLEAEKSGVTGAGDKKKGKKDPAGSTKA